MLIRDLILMTIYIISLIKIIIFNSTVNEIIFYIIISSLLYVILISLELLFPNSKIVLFLTKRIF